MFEDSLIESQNRLSSPNQPWTTALSLTLQCTLAAAIVCLSLLRQESLPFHLDAPKITLPLKVIPHPVPRVESLDAASAAGTPNTSGTPSTPHLSSINRFSQLSTAASDDLPNTAFPGNGMGDSNSLINIPGDPRSGAGPQVTLAAANPASKGILHLSTGVSTGLLLAPIRPTYPRIAIAAHAEGIVEVEAIISKSGHIESAHAVAGPDILRQAALDAIRQAQYTPYLLNGAPTEVETTITVNFKISN